MTSESEYVTPYGTREPDGTALSAQTRPVI